MGAPNDRLRVAFVGTYPPRQCGIATFTRDLREGLGHGSVVALDPLKDALISAGGHQQDPDGGGR